MVKYENYFGQIIFNKNIFYFINEGQFNKSYQDLGNKTFNIISTFGNLNIEFRI